METRLVCSSNKKLTNKKLKKLSMFLAQISCGKIDAPHAEFGFRGKKKPKKRRKRSLLVKVISCDPDVIKPTARFIYNLLTSPIETISDVQYQQFIIKSTFSIIDCGFRYFVDVKYDWLLNFMFFSMSIFNDWQFYLLGCPMANYMFQSLITDENSRHNFLRILITIVIEGDGSSDALSFIPSMKGISVGDLETLTFQDTCGVSDKSYHIFIAIAIYCINMAATKAVSKGITVGLMSKANFRKIDEIIDRATKSIMG